MALFGRSRTEIEKVSNFRRFLFQLGTKQQENMWR